MIPSIIASQVERGIEDFLRTTFPPSNPFFHGILDRLFQERDRLFKGPYISVKLPFRQGTLNRDWFEAFLMDHIPYLHQEKTFKRLGGEEGKSTIISTGTGSGKTECFLYPILDYCYRHRGEPGIKAIIIYPMNALANDQAKRIACLVEKHENLKGNLTAGLFVGQEPADKFKGMVMGPDMVITNKDVLRNSPPDILLTNYKMLDYLLIRPLDFPLWKDNRPESLKYLVVDELHTFDGAQGTDLACLIRRLKARVKAPTGHVCCIGTSATLGAKEDVPELRAYARQIFDETFEKGSVVTEDRYGPAEFFGDSFITRSGAVDVGRADELIPDNFSDWKVFIARQYALWFGREVVGPMDEAWVVKLGGEMKQHAFFRNLILVLKNRTMAMDQMAASLRKIDADLADADDGFILRLLESLLALVSVARRSREEGDGPLPAFLDVRVQVWMRELRRVVSNVERTPNLRFSDDLKPEQLENHLPLVHCRECGAMGWSAVKRRQDNAFASDLQAFYQAFFNYSPNIHFIFPDAEEKGAQREFPTYICGDCLQMGVGDPPASCPSCGLEGKLLPAHMVNQRVKHGDRMYGSHNCPYCEAHDTLTIIGSRSASLLSVVIGQLFNSIYSNDPVRKLLTFSDSVQDASHRAGFFEARTFRFNFRTALQQVVQAENDFLSLRDLPDRFTAFWKNRLDEPDYIATFLAPDMEWFEDYEHLRESGKVPEGSSLLADVEARIRWEILSEYGFRSRIGRTLEKTGCSIASPAIEPLTAAAKYLVEQLQNEIGGWKGLNVEAVLPFLLGFLSQLRTKGAVENPALGAFIRQWGGYYILNRVPFLPNFGRHSRTPVFLTLKRGTRFDALLATGTTESWHQDWLRRALAAHNGKIEEYAEATYRIVLKVLVDQGVLKRHEGLSHPVWGILPHALIVSKNVDQYRCNHCGFFASAPEIERTHWEHMPCRRFRCPGRYERQPPVEDYYGRLYATGEVHRIFAGEHTGLLERKDREQLEKRFIKQHMPASENLLSCTPTLEMGIDIGDLSTVLLCSIPPSQANYLQRIGRSGRQDGNAFNFAMAEGKPHDLYFFEDPEEMLAGSVGTPGVFLNAPAVLERQFVAFCFDRWAESGIGPEVLPRKIGQALSNLVKGENLGLFPFNWLQFIDTERTLLLTHFQKLFKDTLSEASEEKLRDFVEGKQEEEDSLIYKVLDRINGLKKERDSLRKRVQQTNRTIKAKEASNARDQNTADEIAELKRDKTSLNSIIHSINDRDTFNFFTDEGLLPNYAFPEAGVLLRSVIYRRNKKPDGHSKYDTKVYEYQRPGATAIHELAPANTFYADGRKVTIDRVNIELSEPDDWRFCNNCSHFVLEALNTHKSSCPKCGSPIWADEGQKRRMLRMQQVEATTSDRDSRVDDASDVREPQFYHKHMLVDTDPAFIEKAFRIDSDEVPFGFEFLRKADFREINFGSQTGIGDTIDIAGKSVPVDGFMICRACGKVKHAGDAKEFRHALTCRFHGKDTDKPFLDYLYLYRRFSSEAIRILLPVTSFGVPARLHSFIAALYLGLEKKFKGSIDHLATTVTEEPVEGSAIKKQFLVLYDRIPGGTGYLKELTQTEQSMMELIDCALEALKKCPCQNDPEKDGCYRCLYAYRVSRDMAEISRNEAISLLSSIADNRDRLIEIDSVSSISINTLFDSELEARFIEALRRGKPGGQPAVLTKDVIHGKPGWRLRLQNTAYAIEPQVVLGKSEGITIPSKADFVFYPEKREQGIPIAVFTDGFLYHADVAAGNLRIGEDLAQRMALVRSEKFLTWSLSWQDVESQFGKNGGDYYTNYMNHSPATLAKLLDAYDPEYNAKACSGFHKMNGFEAFMAFLNTKERSLWGLYAFLQAINGQRTGLGYATEEWVSERMRDLESTGGWSEVRIPERTSDPEGKWFTSVFVRRDAVDRPTMVMLAAMPKNSMSQPDERHLLQLTARLFDDPDIAAETKTFKTDWNGFLRLYNFLQFLPQARFLTTQGLLQDLYEPLPEATPPFSRPQGQEHDETFLELLSLTDTTLHHVVSATYQSGKLLPEPGFELPGEKGEVLATAELAWPEARLAILLPAEASSTDIFLSQNWTVLQQRELEGQLEAFIAKLPMRQKD